MFEKLWSLLLRPRIKYDPLIKISIRREAISGNYRAYQARYPGVGLAPVLKSNAYGHGLVEVASILQSETPPFLVVDSFFEALLLRRARIKTKILIIGYTRLDLLLRHTLKNVSFTIISLESLRQLAKDLRFPQRIHLKVDTGMHRQGILPAEISAAAGLVRSNPNIVLEGICSHFADAKSEDKSYTRQQIGVWNQVVKAFRQSFPGIAFFHVAATAGLGYQQEIDSNVARLGMGLYGIQQSPFEQLELALALEMRSVISSAKAIAAGEQVGYNLLFTSPAPMRLATVPAGYNDGVDLRLSNAGQFRINGKPCPIVGRVSMNITTIDVTAVPAVRVEDEVEILSRERGAPNSVENIAKICHTTPYEIFIHLPASLRRTVV